MYPENKFEAKLSWWGFIQSVFGYIILILIAGGILAYWGPHIIDYANKNSWRSVIGLVVCALLGLFAIYTLIKEIRMAFSKGAHLRIDETGIFTKEMGHVDFMHIHDIKIIEKNGNPDSLRIIKNDGGLVICDIEDILVVSDDVFRAYEHFRSQWLKNKD